MSSMLERFGKISDEDRAKRQKQMVIPDVIKLATCIAMVTIGAQYQDDCRFGNAPLFLMLGGGILLALSAFKLFAYLTPCEMDDKLIRVIEPLVNIADFAVIIWGSVQIFGAYSRWEYQDTLSEHYCAYTPFMFAFVMLILHWIFAPIAVFAMCIAGCCIGLGKIATPTDEPQTNA